MPRIPKPTKTEMATSKETMKYKSEKSKIGSPSTGNITKNCTALVPCKFWTIHSRMGQRLLWNDDVSKHSAS